MEEVKVNIQNIKDAYDNIIQAMNNISEVDGLDEEYKMLDTIAQTIDDKRIELELELKNLEE